MPFARTFSYYRDLSLVHESFPFLLYMLSVLSSHLHPIGCKKMVFVIQGVRTERLDRGITYIWQILLLIKTYCVPLGSAFNKYVVTVFPIIMIIRTQF